MTLLPTEIPNVCPECGGDFEEESEIFNDEDKEFYKYYECNQCDIIFSMNYVFKNWEIVR